MIEVYPNLFIGNQNDYEINPSLFRDWRVVHACKEPYHRNALGYTGRGAPQDSPYYLFLYDKNGHLILNMVDTNSPEFFNDSMINEAVRYCIEGLKNHQRVLIHCNQGESRAPSLALLVLRRIGFYKDAFDDAVNSFENKYPLYNPKHGILLYVKNHWWKERLYDKN